MAKETVKRQALSADTNDNGEGERRHLREVWLDGGRIVYLTEREIDVVDLLAAGLSNKQIAHKLIISQHTVKAHITHILFKLNAESRTEAAVLWATRKRRKLELC